MTAPGKLISLSIQNLHRRLKYALAKAKVEWRIGEGRFLSQRRFRAEVLAVFESPHLYVITTTRNKQLLKKELADNSQKGDDNHIQSRVHHFETPHAHGFTGYDIKGVSEDIETDFRAKRYNGYIGHHNVRSPNPNQRIFDVKIATPAGKVFEGEVSFNATFSVGILESVSLNMIASADVIPAPRLTKVRNFLWALYDRVRSLIVFSVKDRSRPLTENKTKCQWQRRLTEVATPA